MDSCHHRRCPKTPTCIQTNSRYILGPAPIVWFILDDVNNTSFLFSHTTTSSRWLLASASGWLVIGSDVSGGVVTYQQTDSWLVWAAFSFWHQRHKPYSYQASCCPRTFVVVIKKEEALCPKKMSLAWTMGASPTILNCLLLLYLPNIAWPSSIEFNASLNQNMLRSTTFESIIVRKILEMSGCFLAVKLPFSESRGGPIARSSWLRYNLVTPLLYHSSSPKYSRKCPGNYEDNIALIKHLPLTMNLGRVRNRMKDGANATSDR